MDTAFNISSDSIPCAKEDYIYSLTKVSNKPIHIWFMKFNNPQTIHQIDVLKDKLEKKVVFASNWSEVLELFNEHPTSLCVNCSQIEESNLFEIITMIETFAKLVGLNKKVSISILVNKTTSLNTVKEAQKSKIIGLIPDNNDFGINECLRGLQAQWADIPYWPRNIMNMLPGSKQELKKITDNEIHLTPRQKQIFDIVTTRGCSNKHVAKLLGLSESTVKLHMSAIFKKFNVKNRTQLAVFSKDA